jgi:hypothetical protein
LSEQLVPPPATPTFVSLRRLPLRRAATALALLAVWVGMIARPAAAQTIDPGKAAKVKAAYLLNFIRYTQWPETAFDAPTSPIVISVLGRCDVTGILAEAVERSPTIGGRPLLLRRTELPRAADDAQLTTFAGGLEGSHLVYICDATPQQSQTLLKRLESANVLTVGDVPSFARSGGMLGFVLQGDRIVFEANPKAIQTTQVAVSAKVLQLAQIVEEER